MTEQPATPPAEEPAADKPTEAPLTSAKSPLGTSPDSSTAALEHMQKLHGEEAMAGTAEGEGEAPKAEGEAPAQ